MRDVSKLAWRAAGASRGRPDAGSLMRHAACSCRMLLVGFSCRGVALRALASTRNTPPGYSQSFRGTHTPLTLSQIAALCGSLGARIAALL